MTERYDETLNALRGPAEGRCRQALATIEREWSPEDIEAFCDFLRGLDSDSCLPLCSALASATATPLIELLGEYVLRDEHELRDCAMRSLVRVRAGAIRDVSAVGERILRSLAPDVLLEALPELLSDEEPIVRLEAAGTLADLFPDQALQPLSERLADEPVPVVRASLIEAVGGLAPPEGWSTIRPYVEDGPMVAYAAVAALGKILDPAQFDDFVDLVRALERGGLREAVLGQLVRYGQEQQLPGSLRSLLATLLRSPHRGEALLAAEAAGLVDEKGVVADLLKVLAKSDDADLVRVACSSILRLYGGRILPLFETRGREHLATLAILIRHCGDLGEDAEGVCRQLAFLCAEHVDGSEEALEEAGHANPEAYGRAVSGMPAGPTEAAARLWRRFPDGVRNRARVDWRRMLLSPEAGVRKAGIESLDPNTGFEFLRSLVDIAISDADEDVQEAARKATRRVVGA